MTAPVVLGSANARVGFPAAIAAQRAGRSAMDAAVAAVRCIEDNRDDYGVGTGGIRNVLGQVELDASVMDGRTLAAGAVAAVKGYPHPIEIARTVMQTTPHVLFHDCILGTTNVIVRDASGDIASAVSTSGWGFKWPGRVGDSPIIGAGNYADNRRAGERHERRRHGPRRQRGRARRRLLTVSSCITSR